ncbi:MAG: hypothetical protein JST92_14920, partial [Deltaproteobacteria bacterium]|nr:hypothetical protein [Deltaproteobacteria bacterium]
MLSPIRSAYVAPLALVFVALSARPAAAVQAQLTVSVTHLDDSPVTPASPIITREDAKLTIGYQITDLDADGAHLEYDLCAPSDGGPGYGSSVRLDYDHRPACVTGTGNQGMRILFDHIAGSAGSTQAVIGVVTQTFRFAEDITPDGATLTIPIRLVSDGPAQTVIATATATAIDRLQLQPESYIQILSVATGTDPATGTIPGYIVTYRVGLTQQFYFPGAGPVPHGELTGTLDSGAQIASITTYPNNPALFPDMGPAYPAFYATLYQNLSCTAQTDGAGHATGYAFSLDNILSFEATMDSCDLAVWYPRASSLQAQSTISASFSTGDTSQHSTSIALGDGSIDGDLRHLSGQDAQWHDIGANWSTRTAHLPGYADNLDVYRVPRGLLGYYMDLTGALLVNPSTTLVLPPQFVATSISKVRDESSDSDIANYTVQMSTDAGCGPTTTAWTTVAANDATSLGTARCLLVSVPGLFQNGIDVRVLGRLDDATRTYLEAAPERYMFLHATAYYRMDNSNGVANDDRSEVGGPWAGDPNVKEVSDNMTVWNTSRAGIDDRFFMNFPGPIGSTGYEQVEVPFTQVGFTSDLTDLTFAQTLPLEVDLTGAPYPDSGYPLPLDVNGDAWTPDCTWSAQDRGQTPIVPARWQCTFHGVFPAVREDPFTAPGCTPANTYCLGGGYYATDSSGNP